VRNRLISPDEGLKLVLGRVEPLDAEAVPIAEALGRVLAEDLYASDDVPPFDNSAMDGFAVRASDTRGASPDSPVDLAVVAESRAGSPSSRGPGRGEAVRISTGALLPEGADAVVRVEDTTEAESRVAVLAEVAPGREIRRAGEDVGAGERVLARGTRLGPAELGVAASVGSGELACARRPRVAVLGTGDELVGPGGALGPGQIRNTNGIAVPAQVTEAGGLPVEVATVPDDREATVRAIEGALANDVLVVTGGVSVGPHDHVRPALEALGVEEVFWGVALRPGKPTWFGVKKAGISLGGNPGSSEGATTLVFGLPGNPVSAMVTFHLFVRPALAALAGAADPVRRTTAVLDEDYPKQPGRAHVVRCRLDQRDDGWHVRPTKAQGSHVLTSMLDAEALAYLEVERREVRAGERVEIEIL
jgi:molybdopterin molybdotransferase